MPVASSSPIPASTDLGLGSMLSDQVADETDEQKKKRLAQAAQSRLLGMVPGASALGLGSGAGGGFGSYGG